MNSFQHFQKVEHKLYGSLLQDLNIKAQKFAKAIEGNVFNDHHWRKRARLIDLLTLFQPKSFLEIGFNAGHSSAIVLSIVPIETYVAFDLGLHKYVKPNYNMLRKKFPKTDMTLILGDSTKTVPQFLLNTSEKYDFIHIDGGHRQDIAYQDIVNCKSLAHENTILIMDDCTLHVDNISKPWIKGPTEATQKAISEGIVHEVCMGYHDCKQTILKYNI